MDDSNDKVGVSVVTACFRDLPGLKATGESVIQQDYPIEWVVIDADSGPDLRKYLSELDMGLHKLSWISEKDTGLYDGMNKGFYRSTGEVLLFLNAGDTFQTRTSLSDVMKSYTVENWAWAVALSVRIDKNGEPRAVWEYLDPQLSGLALGTRTFCHQSTFYTRDLLNKVMPYEVTNLAADHLLNIKAFRRNRPKMLPFVTTLFQDGGISSKRPFSASMKDLRKIRKEEGLLLGNSLMIDFLVSWVVVAAVNMGGLLWNFMRTVSRQLVREEIRHSPGINSRESDLGEDLKPQRWV